MQSNKNKNGEGMPCEDYKNYDYIELKIKYYDIPNMLMQGHSQDHFTLGEMAE